MSKNSYEKLSKKFKLIYLAGLFDGEGSFGFWSKGKNRGRIFGGWLFFAKRRKFKHKDTWCWRDRGPRAFAIIDKMINFMSKRRQEKYYVVKRNKISSLSRK